jgi:hypothetical protein
MEVISKEAGSRADWSHSPASVRSSKPSKGDLRISEVGYNKGKIGLKKTNFFDIAENGNIRLQMLERRPYYEAHTQVVLVQRGYRTVWTVGESVWIFEDNSHASAWRTLYIC